MNYYEEFCEVSFEKALAAVRTMKASIVPQGMFDEAGVMDVTASTMSNVGHENLFVCSGAENKRPLQIRKDQKNFWALRKGFFEWLKKDKDAKSCGDVLYAGMNEGFEEGSEFNCYDISFGYLYEEGRVEKKVPRSLRTTVIENYFKTEGFCDKEIYWFEKKMNKSRGVKNEAILYEHRKLFSTPPKQLFRHFIVFDDNCNDAVFLLRNEFIRDFDVYTRAILWLMFASSDDNWLRLQGPQFEGEIVTYLPEDLHCFGRFFLAYGRGKDVYLKRMIHILKRMKSHIEDFEHLFHFFGLRVRKYDYDYCYEKDLLVCGDVESNPGPNQSTDSHLKILAAKEKIENYNLKFKEYYGKRDMQSLREIDDLIVRKANRLRSIEFEESKHSERDCMICSGSITSVGQMDSGEISIADHGEQVQAAPMEQQEVVAAQDKEAATATEDTIKTDVSEFVDEKPKNEVVQKIFSDEVHKTEEKTKRWITARNISINSTTLRNSQVLIRLPIDALANNWMTPNAMPFKLAEWSSLNMIIRIQSSCTKFQQVFVGAAVYYSLDERDDRNQVDNLHTLSQVPGGMMNGSFSTVLEVEAPYYHTVPIIPNVNNTLMRPLTMATLIFYVISPPRAGAGGSATVNYVVNIRFEGTRMFGQRQQFEAITPIPCIPEMDKTVIASIVGNLGSSILRELADKTQKLVGSVESELVHGMRDMNRDKPSKFKQKKVHQSTVTNMASGDGITDSENLRLSSMGTVQHPKFITGTDNRFSYRAIMETFGLIDIFQINAQQTVGTRVWSFRADPAVTGRTTGGLLPQTAAAWAPLDHVVSQFGTWRGDMELQLVFIASGIHVLRFRVCYEPGVDFTTSCDRTSVINKLYELGSSLDGGATKNFLIPYQKLFSLMPTSTGGPVDGTRTVNTGGAISIFIENPLVGQGVAQELEVAVYLRAAPNFEVAVPKTMASGFTSAGVLTDGEEEDEFPVFYETGYQQFGVVFPPPTAPTMSYVAGGVATNFDLGGSTTIIARPSREAIDIDGNVVNPDDGVVYIYTVTALPTRVSVARYIGTDSRFATYSGTWNYLETFKSRSSHVEWNFSLATTAVGEMDKKAAPSKTGAKSKTSDPRLKSATPLKPLVPPASKMAVLQTGEVHDDLKNNLRRMELWQTHNLVLPSTVGSGNTVLRQCIVFGAPCSRSQTTDWQRRNKVTWAHDTFRFARGSVRLTLSLAGENLDDGFFRLVHVEDEAPIIDLVAQRTAGQFEVNGYAETIWQPQQNRTMTLELPTYFLGNLNYNSSYLNNEPFVNRVNSGGNLYIIWVGPARNATLLIHRAIGDDTRFYIFNGVPTRVATPITTVGYYGPTGRQVFNPQTREQVKIALLRGGVEQNPGPVQMSGFFRNEVDLVGRTCEAVMDFVSSLSSGTHIAGNLIQFGCHLTQIVLNSNMVSFTAGVIGLVTSIGLVVPGLIVRIGDFAKYVWRTMFSTHVGESDSIFENAGGIFSMIASCYEIKEKVPKDLCSIPFNLISKASVKHQKITLFLEWFVTSLVNVYNWIMDKVNPEWRVNEIFGDEKKMDAIKTWMEQAQAFCAAENLEEIKADPVKMTALIELRNVGDRLILLFTDKYDKQLATTFRRLLSDLKRRVDDVIQIANEPLHKFEPYVIYLYGPSGIGKSYVLDDVCCGLLQSAGIKRGKNPIFTRVPNQYWDGYHDQPVVKYDDFNIVDNADQTDYEELLRLKTTAQYIGTFAAIHEKQRRIKPYIVAIASNSGYPIVAQMKSSDALYRRRDALYRVEFSTLMKACVKHVGGLLTLSCAGCRTENRELIESGKHLYFRKCDSTKEGLDGPKLSYRNFMQQAIRDWLIYFEAEKRNVEKRRAALDELYLMGQGLMTTIALRKPVEPETERLQKFTDGILALNSDRAEVAIAHVDQFSQFFMDRRYQELDEVVASMKDKLRFPNIYSKAKSVLKQVCKSEAFAFLRSKNAVEEAQVEGPDMEFDTASESSLGGSSNSSFSNIVFEKPKLNRFYNNHGERLIEEEVKPLPGALLLESTMVAIQTIKDTLNIKDLTYDPGEGTSAEASKGEMYVVSNLIGRAYNKIFLRERKCICRVPRSYCDPNGVLEHINVTGRNGEIFRIPAYVTSTEEIVFGHCARATVSDHRNLITALVERINGERAHRNVDDRVEVSIPADVNSFDLYNELVRRKNCNFSKRALCGEILRTIITITAAVTVAYKVMKFVIGFIKGVFSLMKGKSEDTGEVYVSGGDKAPLRSSKISSVKFYNRMGRSAVGQSCSDVFGVVRKNTAYLIWTRDDIEVRAHVLFIGGQKAIMQHHALIEMPEKAKLICGDCEHTISAKELKITRFDKTDLVCVEFPAKVNPFKDIRKHFVSIKNSKAMPTTFTFYQYKDGNEKIIECVACEPAERIMCYDSINNVELSGFEYDKSGAGMCGTALISDYAPRIYALHVSKSLITGKGMAQLVTVEMLDQMFSKRDIKSIVENADGQVCRFEVPKGVVQLGQAPNGNVWHQTKTELKPAITRDVLRELGQKLPAQLKTVGEVEPGYGAISRGVSHQVKRGEFPFEIVQIVKEHMRHKILNECVPQIWVPRSRTVQEAICGNSNIQDFTAMKLSTSCGYPLSVTHASKSSLIQVNQEKDGPVAYINPILENQLERHHELRTRGIVPETIFQCVAKDEKLVKEKVANVRLINASPVELTIATRQYFIDFSIAFKANRFKLNHGVGIRLKSTDSEKLVRTLKFEKVCCGDFSKFGPTLNTEVVNCAYKNIISWYNFHSRDKPGDDVLIRNIIAQEHLNVRQVAGDAYFRVETGHPSGGALTVEINSLCAIYYIKIAFVEITGLSVDHFDEHVGLVVYGDDVIFGISDEISEIFNNESLSMFFAKYGHKYTDVIKDGKIRKWCNMSEASFLKHSFRIHEGRWVAALEKLSLEDSINWTRSSDKKEEEEIAYLQSEQCMLESWGWGKEYFYQNAVKLATFWKARKRALRYRTFEEVGALRDTQPDLFY